MSELYQWYVFLDPPGYYRRPCPMRKVDGTLTIPRARFDLGPVRPRPPNWRERFAVWARLAPRHGRLCWHRVWPARSLTPEGAREVLAKWRAGFPEIVKLWDSERYRK